LLPHEDKLLRLTLNDDAFAAAALTMHQNTDVQGLDPRTCALVRLGALHAIGAAQGSYGCSVDASLAAGASVEEIVDSLIAVAPMIGLPRAVAAAPELAIALGFDVESALEEGTERAS
jgi:alkylhydroperoxidase/carboxymuconolactone decarboxylase family protein YurZ